MRRDFVTQILDEMEHDPSIIFLTGDLGFNALEKIKERFPDRFLNVGIAEQHMIGMASGLALEGKKVIAYSIASFITMRPYEQIRDDVCYHNLDVKIIGTGGGYNYATHGVTEYWIVDARGTKLIFEILKHTSKGYVKTRKVGGWMASQVFGKSFRLTPGTGADGQPEYELQVR